MPGTRGFRWALTSPLLHLLSVTDTVFNLLYRVESHDHSLLVWGDIVHFPQIQIARPGVSIAFDQDPILSAETRSKLLDVVSSDKLLIAGIHLGELGFAHIKRKGMGYEIFYEA